jgi:uncharacterized protein
MQRISDPRPWQREPWPWFLMAFPAASIVLGIALWYLAARTQDGLVVDDYYKQGLAINQVIERETRAGALGLRAVLTFNPEQTRVRLALEGDLVHASEIILRLVHPTRVGHDQTAALVHAGGGVFDGPLKTPAAGRWRVVLEDAAEAWRLTGSWHTQETGIALGRSTAR